MDSLPNPIEFIRVVGGLYEPILRFFTDAFLLSNFGPFVAGTLVLLGFVILGILIIRVILTVSRIGAARNVVRTAADSGDFTARFSSIDDALKRNSAVSEAWSSFAAGLSHPDPHSSGVATSAVIRSPVRPHLLFGAEESGLGLSYFRLWPNLFVGIGLLLTFAGLISALSVAVRGFGREEATSAELQLSLGKLLEVSAAKFYSSLAALAVSLFLTVFVRLGQSMISHALFKLANAIEERVPAISGESLLEHQIQELQEHTRQLKTFNTDLAMKIGESVERAVGNAMQGVSEKLEKFSSNLGQDNVTAIRDIGESVTRSLHGAAGDSLNRLGDRLDTVGGALSGLVTSLERSGQSFQDDMSAAMQGLRADLTGMTASLSGVSEELRSTLQDGAAGITTSLEAAIRGLTAATERSAGQMEEAVKRLSDGVRIAAESAAEQASNTVTQAGTSAGRQLIDTVTTVADGLSAGFAPVQAAATSLSGSLLAMQAAADRLDVGMGRATEGAANAGARIQEAAQHVVTASQALRQTVEPALAATQRIQEAAALMREAAEATGQAAKGIADDLQATRTLWERHSARFDDVDRALGDTFARLTQALADNLQRLSDFVKETDSQFSQAVAVLADAIQDLSEARPAEPARQ